MARVIALNLLLIFLPFILYSAYIMIEKKPETRQDFWQLIPLKPLFIIGFIMMGIFYITQINMVPETKDGIYHPAIVKDGKVIPGYIEPLDSKPLNNKLLNKDKKAPIKDESAAEKNKADNPAGAEKPSPDLTPEKLTDPEKQPEKIEPESKEDQTEKEI